MTIPITTFTGTLRQISPKSLNATGRSVLLTCAPKFLPASDEERAARLERVRDNLSPYLTHVYADARPHRRWSGDLFADVDDEHRLDRGSYFSVCQRDDGYDAGTLEAELNAYRSGEADFYVIFMDGLIEGNAVQLNMPQSAHIFTVIAHPDKLVEHLPVEAPEQLRSVLIEGANRQGPVVVTLGTVITSARIEGVIDLRQRDAQQWLWDTYVRGRIIPTQGSGFLDILPELLDPQLGGSADSNARLQAIGADLRRAGVNGLIYPSARTDVGVGYDGDRIVRFRGWNMVLYRAQPPREAVHLDLGGWETEWFWNRIKLHKQVDSNGRVSEWYVEGLDALNMAIYDHKMKVRGII